MPAPSITISMTQKATINVGIAAGTRRPSTSRTPDATAPATPNSESGFAASPEATQVKSLPDGIPEKIEIDVGGQKPHWVTATIVKVSGQRLTCRLDSNTLRETKLYARDIEWRVPVVA